MCFAPKKQEETTIPGFCHNLCEKVPVEDLCSAFVPLVEIITDNLEEKTSDIAKYYDKRYRPLVHLSCSLDVTHVWVTSPHAHFTFSTLAAR